MTLRPNLHGYSRLSDPGSSGKTWLLSHQANGEPLRPVALNQAKKLEP